jgi:putative hemolysin
MSTLNQSATLKHQESEAIAPKILFPHLPARESYTVRFARDSELKKVFQLRHDVFYKELGATSPNTEAAELDFDIYDPYCDHLIAACGDEIVGTYRLLPVARALKNKLPPYCATEYDVSPLVRSFGDSLIELGRTCVAKEHRNGVVPRLLWKHLLKHIIENNYRAIMGCVSIHGLSDEQSLQTREHLMSTNMWHDKWDLTSLLPATEHSSKELPPETHPELFIPPLMKAYAGLGAKVCGGPAMDRDFHCTDFLMLAEISKIPERYRRVFLS